MRIFGWKLVGWQFGPWHLLGVNTWHDHYGDRWYVDRFICIGPLQTRWSK